jgi:hypothetical protein
VLAERLLTLRELKKQHKTQIELLSQSIKMALERIYKQNLRRGFEERDESMTRTDHLIYLKQMKNEVKQKVDARIFDKN